MMQSTQLLQNENESCGSSSLSVVSNDAIWRNWQTQSLETITVSIFSCCIYSTLAQLVRASDSYPEGRLFNSDMCYQRRREAVDNGYFDSQAVIRQRSTTSSTLVRFQLDSLQELMQPYHYSHDA